MRSLASIDTAKLLATTTPEDRATECKAIVDQLSAADLLKMADTFAKLKGVIADLIEDTARIVLDGDGLGDDGDARDAPRQFGGFTRVLDETWLRDDPDGAVSMKMY